MSSMLAPGCTAVAVVAVVAAVASVAEAALDQVVVAAAASVLEEADLGLACSQYDSLARISGSGGESGQGW
jgi:hypothetical protein